MPVWPNGSSTIPRVTSEFNPSRRNPVTGIVQPHQGIDLVGWSTVRSPVAGTIIFAGYNGGYGNLVKVRAANGDVFWLAHNRSFLKRSGSVKQGEAVAIMGTTGNSTGVHCHYETHPKGGKAINPRTYMSQNTGSGSGTTAGGKLIEDGKLGASTIKKLQSVLGLKQDGVFGPATIKALQDRLKAVGHKITADGALGPATIKALQTFLLGGKQADGIWGDNTTRGLQVYLNSGGKFPLPAPPKPAPPKPTTPPASTKLTVDGNLGPATIKALQKLLGVAQDGSLGPATIKALQKATGQAQDGLQGPNTIKALQMNIGATADGELGPDTIKKLQTFLNAGTKLKAVTITKPTTPPVTTRTPVYPGTSVAYNTPNGGVLNDEGKKIASRTPANASIQYLYIHHTAGTQDDTTYFLSANDRKSSPTWYVKANGTTVEFVRPKDRPWSTGAIDNLSLTIETQNSSGSPTWGISDASHERIAQIAAWLSQQKSVDGVNVEFTLDRSHVKGHKEAPGASTACPGPSMDLDRIVARAKEIVAGTVPPQPEEPIKIPAALTLSWEAFKAEMDKFLK